MRRKQKDLEDITKVKTAQRLRKLDMLLHLHRAVSTCTEEYSLVVPELTPLAEGWTMEDDRRLLLCAWRDGVPNPGFDDFGQDRAALVSRINSLVSGMKQLHARAHGSDVTFDHRALMDAAQGFTRQQHRMVVDCLVEFGFPNAQEFHAVVGITTKSAKVVGEYAKSVMAAAQSRDSESLVEPLSTYMAGRIVSRVQLFNEIRQIDLTRLADRDREIVAFVKRTGFTRLRDCPQIVSTFGTESPDRKLSPYLRDLARTPRIPPPVSKRLDAGLPGLPVTLTDSLVLVSLGTVVWDREGFHCTRYIYPAGYIAEKLWMSVRHQNKKVWYQQMILDKGDDAPVFRVFEKGHDSISFQGSTPTSPWSGVIKAITERGGKGTTISGPSNFGLTHPQVQEWVRQLPNAEKCRYYGMPERTSGPAPRDVEDGNRREGSRSRATTVDFGKLLWTAQKRERSEEDDDSG
jgi:hypothetical protein